MPTLLPFSDFQRNNLNRFLIKPWKPMRLLRILLDEQLKPVKKKLLETN